MKQILQSLKTGKTEIPTVPVPQPCTGKILIKTSKTVIIDVREESEVFNQGLIKGAIHIPRGLIEFKLAPNSSDNPMHIDDETNILLYCAGGYRSALAAKTLLDLGFKNVYNIGGFNEWCNSGGEIQAHL